MMRPDHWLSYPPNRRRAGRAGSAGTVIAAAAAGLIAGVTQHPDWLGPAPMHQISDSALNVADSSAGALTASTSTVAGDPPAPAPPPPNGSVTTHSFNPIVAGRPDTRTADPAETGSDSASSGEGSYVFHPYIDNGPSGTASQITAAPRGTTAITRTPHTAGQHETEQQASQGDRHISRQTKATDDKDGDGQATTQVPDRSDSTARSRIARALPPGFTPSEPRRTPPAPTSSDPTYEPTETQPEPAKPTPGTSYAPDQAGPPPETSLNTGPPPGTSLTPVTCPPAVADATCYQRGPASSASAGNPTPSITTPAALPEAGPSEILEPSSAPRSDSSGDCQSAGNESDSNVRIQSWGDLSQLIMNRIQDCIDQAMSNSSSGWNTTGSNASSNSLSPSSGSGDKERRSSSGSSSSSKKGHQKN